MLRSRIYCGRKVPTQNVRRLSDGSVDWRQANVADAGIAGFVRDYLAKSFPNGWTQINAIGGWLDAASGQTITEPSVIFEVLHDHADVSLVRAVAERYKVRFQQDSVLVTTETIPNVSFI